MKYAVEVLIWLTYLLNQYTLVTRIVVCGLDLVCTYCLGSNFNSYKFICDYFLFVGNLISSMKRLFVGVKSYHTAPFEV